MSFWHFQGQKRAWNAFPYTTLENVILENAKISNISNLRIFCVDYYFTLSYFQRFTFFISLKGKVRLFCESNPTSSLCRRKDESKIEEPKRKEDKSDTIMKVCRLPPSTVHIVHKLRNLVQKHQNNPIFKCLRKLIFHVLSVRLEEAERC